MKTLKIIFGNFKRDMVGNIVTLIFVTLSVFLMNLSLSEFSHLRYSNNFIRECGLYDDYIYIAPPFKKVSQNDAMRYVSERLAVLQEEGVIKTMFAAVSYSAPREQGNWEGDRWKVTIYPRTLTDNLAFPTSRGHWFRADDFNGDFLPIILGANFSARYRLGDVFTLPIITGADDYTPNRYEECRVVGFLKRGTKILRSGGSGSDMSTDQVFVNADDQIIIAVDEPVVPSLPGYCVKVSAENAQRLIDEIFDIAPSFTFKAMADEAYEQNRLLTAMQSTVFFLMMIVCVTGVSSGNLLGAASCKKRYAVYFMCGMPWKQGIRVTVTESVIKLIVPSAVGYAMFLDWCGKHAFDNTRVTELNVIVTVLFLTVVFLATSLLPLLDIGRTAPVKIITEM